MSKIVNTDGLKRFRQDIDDRYAFNNGNYEEMTVGNADQLVSNRYIEDTAPYKVRTTGGGADVGSFAYNTIVGASNIFRNACRTSTVGSVGGITFSQTNGLWSFSGTRTTGTGYLTPLTNYNVPANHYVMFLCDNYTEVNGNTAWAPVCSNAMGWRYRDGCGKTTGASGVSINVANGYTFPDNFKMRCAYIDLTEMFGGNAFIEDLLSKIDPNGTDTNSNSMPKLTAWMKKYFPDLLARSTTNNSNAIVSSKATQYITKGFNLYDNATGKAAVIPGGQTYQITGSYTTLTYKEFGLDGNDKTITPDAKGIFTIPLSGTIVVAGGDIDTCIHLVWSGYRNGDFEEYQERTLTFDPTLTLRGIPRLTETGELYYEGDEYYSDGTVIFKCEYRAYTSGDYDDPNVLTNGTNSVALLETPVVSTAYTGFHAPQVVDDWGVENMAGIAYYAVVGHKTNYTINLRDKLQSLPDIPETTGNYIVNYDQDERMCKFINMPQVLPDLPESDGIYFLKLTINDGINELTWEELN